MSGLLQEMGGFPLQAALQPSPYEGSRYLVVTKLTGGKLELG
jgi:hypothetical protein